MHSLYFGSGLNGVGQVVKHFLVINKSPKSVSKEQKSTHLFTLESAKCPSIVHC